MPDELKAMPSGEGVACPVVPLVGLLGTKTIQLPHALGEVPPGRLDDVGKDSPVIIIPEFFPLCIPAGGNMIEVTGIL
ncbi:MAG: hypothetical protein PHC90_07965 [Syntrophorhabdaceae bacterium]|nr:hypothetical protein [Syntrophorhabdaceae bacterium]